MDLTMLSLRDVNLMKGDTIHISIPELGARAREIKGTPVGLFTNSFKTRVVIQEETGPYAGSGHFSYHVLASNITCSELKLAPAIDSKEVQPGDVIQRMCELWLVLGRGKEGKDEYLLVRRQDTSDAHEAATRWFADYVVGLVYRPETKAEPLDLHKEIPLSAVKLPTQTPAVPEMKVPFALKDVIQDTITKDIGVIQKISEPNKEFVMNFRRNPGSGYAKVVSFENASRYRLLTPEMYIQEEAANVPPGWKADSWLATLVNTYGEGRGPKCIQDWVGMVIFQGEVARLRALPPPIPKGWWNS